MVGSLLGLPTDHVRCYRPRAEGALGSHKLASGPNVSAQHMAVYYLSGSLGCVRALPPDAHPLAAAAVEQITGQGNLQRVHDMLNQGYALWRRQAEVDAERLLNEPQVWAKVREVAAALIDSGASGLSRGQVEALVGDPCHLTEYQVWTPDLDGLDIP